MNEVDSVYFNTYVRIHDDKTAVILVSKRIAASGSSKTMAAALKAESAPGEAPAADALVAEAAEEDPHAYPDDSADPFAGFALDALFDESKNAEAIAVDSEESESECEDDSVRGHFQSAWFKAKDMEESKSKSGKGTGAQEAAELKKVPKKPTKTAAKKS